MDRMEEINGETEQNAEDAEQSTEKIEQNGTKEAPGVTLIFVDEVRMGLQLVTNFTWYWCCLAKYSLHI